MIFICLSDKRNFVVHCSSD